MSIAIVDQGRSNEIPFSPAMFNYSSIEPPAIDVPEFGFAGFRARYPINAPDAFQEFLVFLGASYFRAVARDQNYGLSARGVAIDTAEPTGEEFPLFQKFWIEKPGIDDGTLTVYALLDSPSLTGGYRFKATPGAETVIEVEAALFVREEIRKIGIAPLTSMFLFNGMNRAGFDDYRSAVHDSDGLQILTSKGEWLWRPLSNPADLQISYFGDGNPQGFGLIQRARSADDFGDPEAGYERRPSVWIEPMGDWGKGFVELVEIPTDREINDNIVVYWRPDGDVPVGGPRRVAYRMRWTDDLFPPAEILWVSSSRAGLTLDGNFRLFAVEYSARHGSSRPDPEGLDLSVSASAGEIRNAHIHPSSSDDKLLVTFELDTGSSDLIELRLALSREGKQAGETWLYRWTPS